jgi:hypothetical protein
MTGPKAVGSVEQMHLGSLKYAAQGEDLSTNVKGCAKGNRNHGGHRDLHLEVYATDRPKGVRCIAFL